MFVLSCYLIQERVFIAASRDRALPATPGMLGDFEDGLRLQLILEVRVVDSVWVELGKLVDLDKSSFESEPVLC